MARPGFMQNFARNMQQGMAASSNESVSETRGTVAVTDPQQQPIGQGKYSETTTTISEGCDAGCQQERAQNSARYANQDAQRRATAATLSSYALRTETLFPGNQKFGLLFFSGLKKMK